MDLAELVPGDAERSASKRRNLRTNAVPSPCLERAQTRREWLLSSGPVLALLALVPFLPLAGLTHAVLPELRLAVHAAGALQRLVVLLAEQGEVTYALCIAVG